MENSINFEVYESKQFRSVEIRVVDYLNKNEGHSLNK